MTADHSEIGNLRLASYKEGDQIMPSAAQMTE
jgi:hypothetical protein